MGVEGIEPTRITKDICFTDRRAYLRHTILPGWNGGDRTPEYLIQSQVPYHLATSQWGDRRDSNPQPLESQSSALPIELRPTQFWRKVKESNPYVSPHPGIQHQLLANPAAPSSIGLGGQIRTDDIPVPNRTLYQAELLPDIWRRGRESNSRTR